MGGGPWKIQLPIPPVAFQYATLEELSPQRTDLLPFLLFLAGCPKSFLRAGVAAHVNCRPGVFHLSSV